MSALDDPQVLDQLDSQDMLRCLHDIPEMCRQAWHMAQDCELPASYTEVDEVVVLGMGGSAIGGDLASSLAAGEAKLPILVHREYNLPTFVDERTLVIASSYSGMTEETLSAFEQALKTKSKKLVLTTGGTLKTMAEQNGIPVFTFDYKAQPRAALPFSLLPLLAFFQRLGFIGDIEEDVTETIGILERLSSRMGETVPVHENPAKQLAESLYGRLAVIYGSGITAQVASRWKAQFNENSKAWAFHEVFPELNHNAVVGYQFPRALADRIMVILLDSSLLPQRIQLRYEVTCQLLRQAGIGYQLVDGKGNSALSHLMSQVLFGDYASFYLAMLYGTDPSPVKAIDYLKGELVKG